MPDTTDLLGLAIDKNPVDFASAFDAILRDKAITALENKKIELAQSIYGDPEDTDDTVDIDDVDFDDDDLDDLDLDLDDLDLDDLDLGSDEGEGADEDA
ncbi:MAG: hypothetical protein EB127_15625 [Alphaproteobacteria bacterium]|nr:hypothetical protein [Alphaproteobacteria bacterium]